MMVSALIPYDAVAAEENMMMVIMNSSHLLRA